MLRFWVWLQVTAAPACWVVAAQGLGWEGHVVEVAVVSIQRGVRLVSRPVTLGKSWNLITASQTLSRTDLLTLVASRHALPPSKCPCTGWPLLSSVATFFERGDSSDWCSPIVEEGRNVACKMWLTGRKTQAPQVSTRRNPGFSNWPNVSQVTVKSRMRYKRLFKDTYVLKVVF